MQRQQITILTKNVLDVGFINLRTKYETQFGNLINS